MSLSPVSQRVLALGALLTAAGCAQFSRTPVSASPAAAPEPPVQAAATPVLPPSATTSAPPPAPAPAPPVSVVELSARAGEQSLLAGLRAYEDGQYAESEKKLRTALKAGLASPKDRAAAHKTLAFIYCTSDRIPACEAAFRSARAASAGFTLSKAEAGHPVWGPVYRSVVGAR